jgi:hypothetical protein
MIAVGEIPRKPQDIRGCTQVAREGILSQHALDQAEEAASSADLAPTYRSVGF